MNTTVSGDSLSLNIDYPATKTSDITSIVRNLNQIINESIKTLEQELMKLKKENYQINKYQDKNIHVSGLHVEPGFLLMNKLQRYDLGEIFWQKIVDTIITFNELECTDYNYGLPLANLGICQIAQKKNSIGLHNLMRAYENDKYTLDKNGLPSTDPESAIINSDLLTQFEHNRHLPIGLYQLLEVRVKNQGFTTTKNFTDLILKLTPHERIHLFFVMSELWQSINLIEVGNNFISRGKMLTSLFGSCIWLEDRLKKKQRSSNQLLELFRVDLANKGIVENFQKKFITDINILYNEIESVYSDPYGYERMTYYIRNFAVHNYDSSASMFFEESVKYAVTIVYIVLEYGY